jgi:adenylate cyclase
LNGYKAAIEMQERVADFNASAKAPIILKLGLHTGPCIAVTLNDRLDYFGSAVNLAARLQGESLGGDIVMSNETAQLCRSRLASRRDEVSEEVVRLRGIEAVVKFLRVRIPQERRSN